MYLPRLLNLERELKQKSLFLFGPRQTGKSSLIRHDLKQYPAYSLLDQQTYLDLSQNPRRLREELGNKPDILIIDEIQKLPGLLDQVHLMIEEYGVHFLLTGSSARKLRQAGVNLLGGRARIKYLHPFSYQELGKRFHLEKALNHGLIPSIYFSTEHQGDLKTYIGTYLQQEIAAEGLTRNLPAFSRFLEVAALCNGKMLNFSKISNDAQVPLTTVREYFQILKDTLIAFEVPAWGHSQKRKAIGISKFYFFDPGVVRFLQHRRWIASGSPEFGEAFEHYIYHELKTFLDYRLPEEEIYYWRSKSGFEVDFVAGEIAFEVKASRNISRQDLKGLKALREEGKLRSFYLICFEERVREIEGIKVLPWETFLQMLWQGSFKFQF